MYVLVIKPDGITLTRLNNCYFVIVTAPAQTVAIVEDFVDAIGVVVALAVAIAAAGSHTCTNSDTT